MKPASVPGPTGSPNCADLRQARRSLDGAVHQHRPCRPRRLRIQIVAHHDIRNALPRKGIGQPSGRPAGGEQALHRIQCADGLRRGQRDRVAHAPRAVAEHLQRLVVAGAPHLGGERRAGHHQHASRSASLRCARRASRRSSCQYCGIASNAPGGVSRPGPGQRGAGRQRDQHHDADGDPLVAFGVGERVASTRVAARCPAAGCGPADAPGRAPAAAGSRGSSLCTLRSGVPAASRNSLHLVGHRRSQPAGVSDGQQDDADKQHRDQPAAGRHRAHRQPGQPGRRDQRGGQHRHRPGDQRRARRGVRARRTASSCRCRAAPRSATSIAW